MLAVAISVARACINTLTHCLTHVYEQASRRCYLRVAKAHSAETTAEVTQVSGRGIGREERETGRQAEEIRTGREKRQDWGREVKRLEHFIERIWR